MKYDLHTHTHYSKCSNLKPEILLKLAKKRGMDGIAITDHHSIKGALKASKLNKDKNFEVIIGEEITTDIGEILAYYVKVPIINNNFFSAIEKIKEQNGIAIISHPFRTSINPHHHFKYPLSKIKNFVDGIEIFNARNLPGNNKKAIDAAKFLNIAGTAGSDAHFSFEIARAYTIFNNNLREAIKQKKTNYKGTIIFGPFGGLLSYMRTRFFKTTYVNKDFA